MYGNIAKAHSKDKKTRYYYYCKNTVTPTGHECSFRLNIEQTEINKFVAKVISAMVNNPRFVEAIQGAKCAEILIDILNGFKYKYIYKFKVSILEGESVKKL